MCSAVSHPLLQLTKKWLPVAAAGARLLPNAFSLLLGFWSLRPAHTGCLLSSRPSRNDGVMMMALKLPQAQHKRQKSTFQIVLLLVVDIFETVSRLFHPLFSLLYYVPYACVCVCAVWKKSLSSSSSSFVPLSWLPSALSARVKDFSLIRKNERTNDRRVLHKVCLPPKKRTKGGDPIKSQNEISHPLTCSTSGKRKVYCCTSVSGMYGHSFLFYLSRKSFAIIYPPFWLSETYGFGPSLDLVTLQSEGGLDVSE